MEKKILVGVDGTRRGLESLSVLGRVLKDAPDTRLVLFHSVQKVAALLNRDICSGLEECNLAYPNQEKMGNTVLNECKRYFASLGFPEDRIDTKLRTDSIDPAQDLIDEADIQGIKTIAVGRRSRSQVQAFLLGSVSNKVAQYALNKVVWVVDSEVRDSGKVLIAIDASPEAENVIGYAADHLAYGSQYKFTFVHIMPPVPPTFWDDGHILSPPEQKEREARIERWRSDWTKKVENYMAEGRRLFTSRGVAQENVDSFILPMKEGVARDLLNEIEEHGFSLMIMGKRSLQERKPFIMGSRATKILQNVKGVGLCLVE